MYNPYYCEVSFLYYALFRREEGAHDALNTPHGQCERGDRDGQNFAGSPTVRKYLENLHQIYHLNNIL